LFLFGVRTWLIINFLQINGSFLFFFVDTYYLHTGHERDGARGTKMNQKH